MTKRGVYVALILSLVGAFTWFLWHRHDRKVQANIEAPILAPKDDAKIIIDPIHHSIETITRRRGSGDTVSQRRFLPDQKSSVVIGKDGSINVETRRFGTEVAPFLGVVANGSLAATAGLDLFYINRWELGAGIHSDLRVFKNTRLFVAVQYNVYDNVSLGVGIDHTGHPLGLLSVKF